MHDERTILFISALVKIVKEHIIDAEDTFDGPDDDFNLFVGQCAGYRDALRAIRDLTQIYNISPNEVGFVDNDPRFDIGSITAG